MPIRILLVDDQELIRIGLRLVLDGEPDFVVIGEAESGARAVQLAADLDPDVILMDVHMPGIDGVAATERICGERLRSRIIAITAFDVDDHAFAMLRAGASGFLLKDAGPDSLCAAIRSVHAGEAVVSPRVTRRLIDRFVHRLPSACAPVCEFGELTSRETEILGAIGEGLNNAELAERFTLSESTVKTHVGRILKKLHLRDRVQAVLYACRKSDGERVRALTHRISGD